MTEPSPSGQLVGAVLNGRWRLLRLLGEGGMGAVYEAESVHGEGRRAIKLLHEEYVKEEQVLSRFYAEAQASRSLQHPNIASIAEAATAENGTPYLVMELLQGKSLADWTDTRRPIPQDLTANVAYGVLQALALAHARGIIHRDLKPDNLFMLPDGRGGYTVKVLDFGIAKVMDAAGGMGQKTRTGVLLGTPGYMSPEQIRNAKGVDARADLWSLGIILYEMLTGHEPFTADNEFARLTAVLTEEVRPIEQVAPQLANWGPFFKRALAKDPAQRFQNAEEMARAIGNIARGQPIAPAAAAQPAVAAYAPAPSTHGAPQAGTTRMPSAHPPAPGQPPAGTTKMSGVATPMPAPHAGAAPGGHTHMSAQQPAGTPSYAAPAPSIEVVGPPTQPVAKGAPYWVVAVVGFVCLGLGFAIGALAFGGSHDGASPTTAKPAAPATTTPGATKPAGAR